MAKVLWKVFPVWIVERENGDWKVRQFGLYSTSGGAFDVVNMLNERPSRHAFYEERYLNG